MNYKRFKKEMRKYRVTIVCLFVLLSSVSFADTTDTLHAARVLCWTTEQNLTSASLLMDTVSDEDLQQVDDLRRNLAYRIRYFLDKNLVRWEAYQLRDKNMDLKKELIDRFFSLQDENAYTTLTATLSNLLGPNHVISKAIVSLNSNSPITRQDWENLDWLQHVSHRENGKSITDRVLVRINSIPLNSDILTSSPLILQNLMERAAVSKDWIRHKQASQKLNRTEYNKTAVLSNVRALWDQDKWSECAALAEEYYSTLITKNVRTKTYVYALVYAQRSYVKLGLMDDARRIAAEARDNWGHTDRGQKLGKWLEDNQ